MKFCEKSPLNSAKIKMAVISLIFKLEKKHIPLFWLETSHLNRFWHLNWNLSNFSKFHPYFRHIFGNLEYRQITNTFFPVVRRSYKPILVLIFKF